MTFMPTEAIEVQAEPTFTGELRVLNHSGDLRVTWNADNAEEVAAAKKTFDDLRKKGHLAFTVKTEDGSKGEQIREFDPSAQKIILSPALRGG